MKRFMKFCAVAALLLIAAGLAMGITAGSIQGRESIEQIVESVTHGKIHVGLNRDNWGIQISDSLERLDSGIRYNVNENMDFNKAFEIMTGSINRTYSGSEIHSLEIEVGACEMSMLDSADGDFRLETENVGKIQGYVSNGTLHIKAIRRTGIGEKHCRILLYVPKEFRFEKADIEMGAGALDFSRLEAGKASISVGAGQITCSDSLKADKLDLEVGMGEIVVSGMETTELDAEVGMGSLVLSGDIGGNADVSCAMGSIEMKLAKSEQDYNYELESAMGSVEIGGYSISGLAGEKKIDNKAAGKIKLDCSMGSIEISFMK